MKKSLITKIVLVAASALALVFLALPYISGISGFDFFKSFGEVGYIFKRDFMLGVLFLTPLFVLLATLVLLVFSVLALLGELNVLKNEKFLKVAAKINFIASIVLCAFIALAFLLILIKDAGLGVGCVLILLLAAAALVTTILDKKWNK